MRQVRIIWLAYIERDGRSRFAGPLLHICPQTGMATEVSLLRRASLLTVSASPGETRRGRGREVSSLFSFFRASVETTGLAAVRYSRRCTTFTALPYSTEAQYHYCNARTRKESARIYCSRQRMFSFLHPYSTCCPATTAADNNDHGGSPSPTLANHNAVPRVMNVSYQVQTQRH